MPRPSSCSTVEIDVGTEMERVPAPPEPDTPFRILIAGDFSGRKNRGVFEPGIRRRALEIDRENFDLVLDGLHPELRLPAAVSFRELKDFEPDRLFDRVDFLRSLRRTAAAAAADPQPPDDDPGYLPAQELEETGMVEPLPGPRQAELDARAEAATGAQMRELLHDPDFQALEAAWRSLDFLLRRLETGPALKVYIFDVTKEELAAELKEAADPRATDLYRMLVRDTVETPGAEPWAVWAGNFTFDGGIDDLMLLGSIGGIARAAGAPFLAATSPRLAGCGSFAGPLPDSVPPPGALWQAFRCLSEAAWLGLALPRFLLRMPYGAGTCPIERFEFEEMPDGGEHEAYLWGNPAFACLCLLGQAFMQSGWRLRPGAIRDIEGLPAHVYDLGGEPQLKPCAETLLTEAFAERLLERGLMPLLSLTGRDAVRVMRFQSLADPPAPLAGRWR